MRKQYRVLVDDARNAEVLNKFAKEGFRIAFVTTYSEWHFPVVYMERDVADDYIEERKEEDAGTDSFAITGLQSPDSFRTLGRAGQNA